MDTIRSYLDNMFRSFPQTDDVRNAKAELLRMMEDKYHALKDEGKTEHEAVGTVISEFGDPKEVMESLGVEEKSTQDASEDEHVILTVQEDDIEDYFDAVRFAAKRIAAGISLCIVSVGLFMVAMSLSSEQSGPFTDNIATAVGLGGMFLCIAIGVYMIIQNSTVLKRYSAFKEETLELGEQETQRVLQEQYANGFKSKVATAVFLYIIAVIPVVVTGALMENRDNIIMFATAGMFVMFAIGTNILVRHGMVENACKVLLQEGEYTTAHKRAKPVLDRFDGAYWSLVTIAYFVLSFIIGWEYTWLIWVIAGLAEDAIQELIIHRHR